MSKLRVIAIVPIVLGLLALLTLLLKFGVPRRYQVHERLAGISVFWHDDGAFIFVNQGGELHRSNWFTDRAPDRLRAVLLRSGIEEWRVVAHSTKAYHLSGGRLKVDTLEQTPMLPRWDLEDGNLVAHSRPGMAEVAQGFRWTSAGWARVVETPKADQEERTDQTDFDAVPAETAEKLARAGWKFKMFSGYEAIREPVNLAIELRDESYDLSLRAKRAEQALDLVLPTVSVSLSGKVLQKSPHALFSGAGPRQVSREEFDRLTAKGPPAIGLETPGGELAEAGRLLIEVVCAGLAIWLLWKGPTRELKIAVLVFAVLWIVPSLGTVGWRQLLTVLVIPPAMGIASMAVTTRLVRYRVKRTLVPVGEDACPTFARAKLKELTTAFEAVGFRTHGDRQSTWRMGSQDRRTFIRFLSHGSGHVWAEIQANDEPRTVGRMLCSRKGTKTVFTCDLQSNQELLRDPRTLAQRVPRATGSGDMLMAHQSFAMKTAGTLERIEDPVAADAESYDRWVSALVASKQVTTDGDWFRISPRATVPIAARVLGAWFH